MIQVIDLNIFFHMKAVSILACANPVLAERHDWPRICYVLNLWIMDYPYKQTESIENNNESATARD